MLILSMNYGSTSLRCNLIDVDNNLTLISISVENITLNTSYIKYENYIGKKYTIEIKILSHEEAIKIIHNILFENSNELKISKNQIDGIGHRVVHGGDRYNEAVLVDDFVIKDIYKLIKLAPLHNLNSVNGIIKCNEYFKNIPNIAVFDTAFHQTIPKENYIYPISKELYEKYKIRKYGFHGISYSYVLDRYATIVNSNKANINIVMCHLGGGSSICAVKDGVSFDTTMGYTPLTGLAMVTRSGTVDPSIVPVIMDIYNISANDVINLLNTKSGYLALCNDKDFKSIVDRSLTGDSDAIFLREYVNNDFKKHLMAMMANLKKVDAVVMTGGIGAKNKEQREMLLSDLEFFGLELDKKKNNLLFNCEGIISTLNSKIPIYVIPTNEELEIAKQTVKVLKRGNNNE